MTPDAERRVREFTKQALVQREWDTALLDIIRACYLEAYAHGIEDASRVAAHFDFGLDSQAGLVRDILALSAHSTGARRDRTAG